MAPVPIIVLPSAGLSIGDIALRLYRAAQASPSEQAAVGLGALGDLDYKLTGLAEDRGQLMAATWESSGQAGAFEYGAVGTPAFVVLPVRETGHDAASLALRIYRNGVLADADFDVAEIGSLGDYRVSGWPVEQDGAAWVLLWEFGGAVSARFWTATTAPFRPIATADFDFVKLQAESTQMIANGCGGRLSTLRRYVNIYEGVGANDRVSATPVDYRVFALVLGVHQVEIEGQKMTTTQVLVSASGVPDDPGNRPGSEWWFIDTCGVKEAIKLCSPLRPDGFTTVHYELEVAR